MVGLVKSYWKNWKQLRKIKVRYNGTASIHSKDVFEDKESVLKFFKEFNTKEK